jgi:hypothetical protein
MISRTTRIIDHGITINSKLNLKLIGVVANTFSANIHTEYRQLIPSHTEMRVYIFTFKPLLAASIILGEEEVSLFEHLRIGKFSKLIFNARKY